MNRFVAARASAAIIAVCGVLILCVRVFLRLEQGESFLQALYFLSQFFTILTNLMAVALFAAIAANRVPSPRIIYSVVIAIACLGGIFHVLLAHLQKLDGLALWADHGVHTFMPIISVVWLLCFGPTRKVTISDPAAWVAWPLLYFGYALLRASWSGFYPYPFLNVPKVGWSGLAINVAGMILVFVATGFALTALVRFLRSTDQSG